MNRTNRADAAAKYLEAIGFVKPTAFDVTNISAPLGPWWRDKERRLAKLPRIRFVHNLGVYQLTATNGVRVFGNDIESTYLRWIKSELDRNAAEDLSDFPTNCDCCYEDSLPVPNLETLVWSGLGLILVAALVVLYCVFYR